MQNDCNLNHKAIRRSLCDLIKSQPYTHALTLNSDRALSQVRLRGIFGTFCHDIDRKMLGRQKVCGYPTHLRFNAIAMPEALETNAHLHVHADLALLLEKFGEDHAREVIRCEWLKATRGSGSVHVDPLYGDGFAWYSTKRFNGLDPVYFLSSDFHQN
jgi:hypothetical protein